MDFILIVKTVLKTKQENGKRAIPSDIKSHKKIKNDNPSEKSKEYWRRKNKELRESGHYKKWQQENKDKIKQYNAYRCKNKKHVISEEEWLECKIYFDYACAYCGIPEKYAKLKYNNYLHKEHVDHNGSNKIDNCVPSCKACNSAKYISELNDWYNENNVIFNVNRLEKIKSWLNKFN